jgi:hypothetical protein|tara:strand:- start:6287 stop:6550 length:264 start_codon:yes stop_codon:yes gene_type:complete
MFMRHSCAILLVSLFLVACSDGGDRVVVPAPPPGGQPPVAPEPPRLQSFSAFVRDVFADPADASPRDINDLEFVSDAEDDDFADLLR